ncbi:MAG: peptidylprolyl isomerase, partial [Elusimicrobia bacterium]|nr:peptidylprolyl isomerase [Elusimicrobiota bacterium]
MKKTICFGLFLLFCFQGCSKKNEVIAKIGDDKITAKILEERMREAPASYMGFLSTEAGKKQFLDLLVRERVVLEAARKEGVKKSKEYIDALNDFKKDQIRRLKDFEESLLMEFYVKKLNSKRIVPSDQEVEKYYAENKKDFTRPVEITAKHILLNTVEEAKKVLERIKSGEDFSKLARELSKDSVSAGKGGLIGPFKKGDLVPEFEKAVFPLKINEVSDVIKTQFGYHIIKKVSEKTLTAMSSQNAKKYIRNILQKVKFDAWLEEAKK